MSQLSKSNFTTAQNNRFDDNLPSRSTTRDDIRDLAVDVKDSAMFLDDNFIDEDSFATDSATKAPSQQSVKAYIDPLIQRVKVPVSSSEILNLFSSPKQLVAAPGVGKLLVVLNTTIVYNFVSAAYATNTSLQITYGTNSFYSGMSGIISLSNSAVAVPISSIVGNFAVSTLENTALNLKVAVGNPTTGGGNLVVYLTYATITL